LPDENRIVEFDEPQHFSKARLVTLSHYGAEFQWGFGVEHWRDLCRLIDAEDDSPFDRDERRAWYDVLRDMVPRLYNFQPTVRLYAGDRVWCALDPAAQEDRKAFSRFLGGSRRSGTADQK
jgi:hypothetical protein